MAIPESTAALSVSVDRVCLAMEEPIDELDTDMGDRKVLVAYRQAYCGVITLADADGKALDAIRYGHMPQGGQRAIEDSLCGDVAGILARRADLKVVGLADGAPEMQHMLDRILQDYDAEAVVIDFWHLVEKLSAAVKAVGENLADHIPRWKQSLLTDERAIHSIKGEIEAWYEAVSGDEDVPDALHDAYTYLDNNAERMNYAALVRQGLPIGSGTVEATCKTLVTTRMKRAGARWKHPGGQACLGLRALATSSRWQPAMRIFTDSYVKNVQPRMAA